MGPSGALGDKSVLYWVVHHWAGSGPISVVFGPLTGGVPVNGPNDHTARLDVESAGGARICYWASPIQLESVLIIKSKVRQKIYQIISPHPRILNHFLILIFL